MISSASELKLAVKSKSFASQARRIAKVFKTLGDDEVKIFKTFSNSTHVNLS